MAARERLAGGRGARRAGPLALALMLAAGAIAALAVARAAPEPTTVTITIRYSAFEPSRVEVPRGVPVTFVIVNEDPIDHEWIIGDAALHAGHRTGTEPVHGARASEVSVPALETRVTTVSFSEPGEVAMICHLPRHEAYGMVGTIVVS